MRFFRKNDGAVSVFLVIILVPMLVVTSLFVDVARLHLGQAMIDSAGDLTLNTAMTARELMAALAPPEEEAEEDDS